MPVMYVVFKDLLQSTGSINSIENSLYNAGAKHFEFDHETKIGKIVFDDIDSSEIILIDAIKQVGYHADVIEMIEE